MGAKGGKRPGLHFPVTPSWILLATGRLKASKMTVETLGEKIGADKSSVSRIFDGTSKASVLIPKICEALNIPMPYEGLLDPIQQRWLIALRTLRSANKPSRLQFITSQLEGLARNVEAHLKRKTELEHEEPFVWSLDPALPANQIVNEDVDEDKDTGK